MRPRARARMACSGLDEDHTPLPERRLGGDERLRALLEEIPPGAGTLDVVAWMLARANARATRQALEGGGVQRLGQRLGPVGWHGALRWRTPLQAAWQLALVGGVAWVGWQLLRWAVLQAQWHGSPADCAAAAGACWAAVWENRTLLLFGTMPAAQRPQAAWTCALLLAAALLPLLRPLAPRWRAAACLLALAGAAATMAGLGGRPPLAPVAWGGLLVTLALALAAMALALPLAVLLALARWQRHKFERSSLARRLSSGVAGCQNIRGPIVIGLVPSNDILKEICWVATSSSKFLGDHFLDHS